MKKKDTLVVKMLPDKKLLIKMDHDEFTRCKKNSDKFEIFLRIAKPIMKFGSRDGYGIFSIPDEIENEQDHISRVINSFFDVQISIMSAWENGVLKSELSHDKITHIVFSQMDAWCKRNFNRKITREDLKHAQAYNKNKNKKWEEKK